MLNQNSPYRIKLATSHQSGVQMLVCCKQGSVLGFYIVVRFKSNIFIEYLDVYCTVQ